MGGRGAYWRKVGTSALSDQTIGKSASSNIRFMREQVGKKIGKHAKDFGLDPKIEADRKKFIEITTAIVNNYQEKRSGSWRGQEGNVTFYSNGKDVVVVNSKKEYVTTLKDGVNNKRFQGADKI